MKTWRAAAVVTLLLAPATADAGKKLPPLTFDQQLVVAGAVEDTFPRPRHPEAPIVLCLDVQSSDDPLEEAPPPPARRAKRKKQRPPEPVLPIIRGAPPELIARLVRPWRVVASALLCRLDPRQPFTLADARTPARLVTVRLRAHIAEGTFRIDWTGRGAQAPGILNSRDCAAARGTLGWAVRCGGTWSE